MVNFVWYRYCIFNLCFYLIILQNACSHLTVADTTSFYFILFYYFYFLFLFSLLFNPPRDQKTTIITYYIVFFFNPIRFYFLIHFLTTQ